MGSELNIEVTDQELAYRSKNYCDLKAFEKRDLFCSSCGNILSHDFRHVYSHPIFNILQCENCKNHFKNVTFSLDKDDSVRYCHICGRERSSSYSCVKRNCPYEFCKTCIKRNVPQSLVDAESGKWKCFACNTKPLWKLRGACAAIMSSLPKRTKSKKVKSRESSSDREDERSNLKNKSYVRRIQLEKTQKLGKKLQAVCDNESPNPLDEEQRPIAVKKQSKSSNLHNGNGKVKTALKFASGAETSRRVLSRDTSSDDNDEIVPLKIIRVVKTKYQREHSTERGKIRTEMRRNKENVREHKEAKSDNVNYQKRTTRGSFNCSNVVLPLDSSSDEFEITEDERMKQSSKTKSNSKAIRKSIPQDSSDDEKESHKNGIRKKSAVKTMPSTSKKLSSKRSETQDKRRKSRITTQTPITAEDETSDSSSDNSVTASMKRLMPTAFAKKPKTMDENCSSTAKRKESSDDEATSNKKSKPKNKENSDDNDDEERTSSNKSGFAKPTKSSTIKPSSAMSKSNKRQSRCSVSREPDDTSQDLNKSSKFSGRNVSVVLNDIAKVFDKKSRRTFDHLRVRNPRQGSDSSSGKEFRSSKLVGRKSYVALRRIQDLEEDQTMEPAGTQQEEIADTTNDDIPKEQSFALKKSILNFFNDMRTAAKKVLNDIDNAEQAYCAKNETMRASMRPSDANRMIIEAKNVLCTLKQNVEKSENTMNEYYGGWCKKTRQKNVWNSPKVSGAGKQVSSTTEQNEKNIVKPTKDSGSDESSGTSTKTVVSERRKKKKSKVIQNSGSESSGNESTKIPSTKKTKDSRAESPEATEANGETSVVSDCASEIFSDEETRMSVNKSNSTSLEKSNADKTEHSEISKNRKLIDSPENMEISNEDEPMDDEPPEQPEGTERVASPTLSQFSGLSETESERPAQKTSVSRSETASPENKNEEPDDLNQSIDPFASNDDESNSDDASKNQKEIETVKRKNSMKRKSMQAKSKSTTLHTDSESEGSKKGNSRVPSPIDDTSKNTKVCEPSKITNTAEVSAGEKSKETEVIDEKNQISEDELSAADTEEFVNPLDTVDTVVEKEPSVTSDTENPVNPLEMVDTVVAKEASAASDTENPVNPLEMVDTVVEKEASAASDTENPGISLIDEPLNIDIERSEPESVGNCDVTSITTELYCSSPGKQSDVQADEQLTSPDSPFNNIVTDDKEIDKDDDFTETSNAKSKKPKSSKDSARSSSSLDPLQFDSSGKNSKKSTSRENSSANSDLSDAENIRAKEMMLMSSNSDDSSGEQESRTRNLRSKKSNDSPLTPPESDSKSEKSFRSLDKSANECDSEGAVEKPSETEKPRKKRSKFRVNKNRYYMEDEQLKKRCEVRVERLEDDMVKRYSRALKQSRKYVELKEIKRLVALDGLGKNRKKADSSSDNEDTTNNLKRNKKKPHAKEREETLMDHLKKVENGESILLSSESDNESSTSGKKDKAIDKSEDSLFAEANRMAKKRMLDSSESGGDEPPTSDAKEDEEVKKTKKVVKKEKLNKSSEDEETKKEKAEKGRWRKNKILTLKISDSDSEDEYKKFNLLQETLSEKKKNQGSDSEEESSPKKQKRVRRRVLHSDSDVEVSPISISDSDSSVKSIKKKKKKKKDDSSDEDMEEKKKTRKRPRRGGRSSDSSMDEKRPKPTRRKRIKTAGTDSDSDEELENSQGTPGKSGRKNIRKVLRDKQVAEDTKQAAKDEEERLRRIADRQKLYNEMYEVRLAGEEKVEKLVLDFDEETKEPLVSVDEGLVKRLKPHQAQGIKFMWDACFESLERTKNTKGSGCILAHCMGLGKSFQIVTLAHTLLMHPETGINTILVVCPLSTVLNWANEFKIWLAEIPTGDHIEVYEMTKMKKNFERKYQLEQWRKTGGVMIIGYEMFRNLSNSGKKVRKNIQESFIRSLVDPGPDLIVCDEGHLLKKEDTALSKAMRRVKTLRRIVLTGTPLQNNLIEYHCMVQFVKPNLLGTKREFMNRFENPITNGQFDDSTEYDVKLMKKRAHVLHKMLEGSVQRFDYSVLTPFLPPKQEYVIFVKLTEVQIKMYQHYLEHYARSHRGVGGSLFADFQSLQRIWTHPYVMQMNAEKVDRANEKKRQDATDSEGSLRDFIDDGSDTPCTSNSSDVQSVSGSDDEKSRPKTKLGTRANPVAEESVATPPAAEETNDETGWWMQFIENDEVFEDISISSKLLILFRILKESEQIGDKVLVFSQSLYSLTLIEKFLGMIDDETQKGNHPENLDGHSGSWALGLDYFRLDGQSSADNRRIWCNIFNKPSNTRARLFLISTRAGGLGINLTAANRVIIFDASWNPSHDVQSIFRIYRFGQKKPCYVYRLLAAGTMEEKIYNRQVTKLSLSCRVVDEQQIERHYSNNALAELYKLELPSETETTLNLPKDRLLAEIFLKYKHVVENYHEHDSLLENQAGEGLDEEERQQAWLEYEEEKKGKRVAPPMPFINYQDQALMQQIQMLNMAQQQNAALNNPAMMADWQNLQRLLQKDYPGIPEAQQKMMASKAVYDMYNYVEKQAMANQSSLPMMNLPAVGVGQFGLNNQIQGPPPVLGHPSVDTLRLYQQSLVQAQNGQKNNYSNNQGHLRDALGLPRQSSINQTGQMTGLSTSSSTVDDDVMEIPSSPDRNPVPSASVPGGSRKSKEE